MEAALALSIIEAILKYGPQAVTTIATAFENKEPTPDDIKALFINKEPEAYF